MKSHRLFSHMKKIFLILSLCIFLSTSYAKIPRIAFGPPTTAARESDPSEFIDHPELWTNLAANSELYLAIDGELLGKHSWLKPMNVQNLVDVLKKQNLRLGIEFSGFGSETKENQGSRAARHIIENILDPIHAAGGSVQTIHLDGPDYRMLKGMHRVPEAGLNLEELAEELRIFYTAIHDKYPNIKIGLIVDPKAWDYDEDTAGFLRYYTQKSGLYLEDVINEIHKTLTTYGEKIGFIELDCPYPYYTKKRSLDHADIDIPDIFRRLQKWSNQRKIPFMIVVNTEPKFPGDIKTFDDEKRIATDIAYREDCLEYITALHKDGIQPDWILLESWYSTPTKNAPETEEGTFFHTTNACIEHIRKVFK